MLRKLAARLGGVHTSNGVILPERGDPENYE
jgi:hypothetical protein